MYLFKRFKDSQSGNVSMMFSIGLISVVTITGVALDFGQLTKAKVILQNQVDSAVLAAAAANIEDGDITLEQENAKRKEIALQVISGNGFDLTGFEPLIKITESNTVYGRVELDYPLTFGGLLGQETIKISAESESGLGVLKPVQVALVLDNTLSMIPNGKMTALKTGAKDLIDAVQRTGEDSKVALVPFSRYVRLPVEEYTADWLELPTEFETEITWQQATHVGGTCHMEIKTRIRDGLEEEYETEVCLDQITTYEEQSKVVESRFDGCVGTRLSPYSELDHTYSNKVPGLLDLIPRQAVGLTYNVNTYCGRKITPLTDDFEALEHEINELYGTDQTYLPSGLLWGQTVLSPGEPFDNADSDIEADKILVFMTDGQNSAQIQTGQEAEEGYKAAPYIATSENEGEYSPDANLATARMCNNIKADGVLIYTIAFQVEDIQTRNLLSACATDPAMALTANTNASLIETFGQISESLEGNARLMR